MLKVQWSSCSPSWATSNCMSGVIFCLYLWFSQGLSVLSIWLASFVKILSIGCISEHCAFLLVAIFDARLKVPKDACSPNSCLLCWYLCVMCSFVDENMKDDSSTIFAYYKEGKTDPTFLYFVDVLKEVEGWCISFHTIWEVATISGFLKCRKLSLGMGVLDLISRVLEYLDWSLVFSALLFLLLTLKSPG